MNGTCERGTSARDLNLKMESARGGQDHRGSNEYDPEPEFPIQPPLEELLQHNAESTLTAVRVSALRIGAPPGMYESKYHPNAEACMAIKSNTSK